MKSIKFSPQNYPLKKQAELYKHLFGGIEFKGTWEKEALGFNRYFSFESVEAFKLMVFF
ncbi:hypothetical protein [Persicobacter diffluens]|uniref:Uncharacterized protein n=1 Tax=Persicobacter diffluens TaxID=981 RepID=A0AAN4W097_9BACT|nr:hypothetical protein PEDI_35750 [Persicobacter diffluens]